MMLNTDGLGTFSAVSQIHWNSGKAYFIDDVDLDGDIDLVMCTEKEVYLLKNVNGDASLWEEEMIANITVQGTYGFWYLLDVDGDGDNDLVSSKMNWLENLDGMYQLAEEKIIIQLDPDHDVSRDIHVHDWDGDGDMDIIANIGIGSMISNIVLATNDGNSNYETSILKDSITSFDGWTFSNMADVDNDGDIDMVAHNGPNDIGWYENTDGQLSDFIFIHEYYDFPGEFDLVDINMDGNLDVFWCGHPGMFWKENKGNFTFAEESVKIGPSGIDATNDIAFGDIDGDGDLDLLSLGRTIQTWPQDIRWYENNLPIVSTNSTFLLQKQLHVFPNPATSHIVIPEADQGSDMYNINGEKVATSFTNQMDISGLPSGTYVLKVRSEHQVLTTLVTVL